VSGISGGVTTVSIVEVGGAVVVAGGVVEAGVAGVVVEVVWPGLALPPPGERPKMPISRRTTAAIAPTARTAGSRRARTPRGSGDGVDELIAP
jgi:hypothetical protein